MSTALFSIGDIVALNSHPYTENLQNVIIGGEPNILTPLMVVGEIHAISTTSILGSSPQKVFRYKCFWFSYKSFTFSECLVTEEHIKLITAINSNISLQGLKRGMSLSLRTAFIEHEKLKSSFSIHGGQRQSAQENNLINPLLSFIPPILQLVDVTKHKPKFPLTYKKTSTPVRWVSAWDVKCIYFDSRSEKIQEAVLPIEVLQLFKENDYTKVELINRGINENSFFLLTKNNQTTIIRPISISYRYGSYYARGFDYLTNSFYDTEIGDSININDIESPIKSTFPNFNIELHPESANKQAITSEFVKAVSEHKLSKHYLRIKYKNKEDRITVRTVKDYKLISINEDEKNVIYLVGFCLLRNSERNFRLDRIQQLEVLNLTY